VEISSIVSQLVFFVRTWPSLYLVSDGVRVDVVQSSHIRSVEDGSSAAVIRFSHRIARMVDVEGSDWRRTWAVVLLAFDSQILIA